MALDNNSEIYDRIKNSLDIVDIIAERVKLRKTGRGYMGLCPFHSEKTPSFHVFSDTQTYYCFGCHEAGNIFTFIMKTEGLNFREALENLAERAGIDLSSYKNNKNKNGSKNFHEILEITAKFFTANLLNSQGAGARAYMERRKMNASDVNRFSLGYSLNSWDSLVNFLRRGGISEQHILDSGLAMPNSSGGIYDRFRGRLMFPVKDISGKIIAFGGRLIDGEGAKYINSPESEIYSKRKNLYLLDIARKSIREKKRSILVEGYMDALRLHKCGFTETVASLGTSLTAEQAELLSRFADRCYICYDSDSAGKNAALRGMYILQEHGLDVRVININDGKDPDEFLTSNTPEDFEKLIAEAEPLVLQHIKYLTPALKNSITRKSAMKELFESLSKLSSDEIIPYKAQLSEITFIPPSELATRLNLFSNSNLNLNLKNENHPEVFKSPESNDFSDLEAGFCSMLFHNADCRLSIEPDEVYKLLKNPIAREVAISILTENPDNLSMLWLSTGDTEKTALIVKGDEFCAHFKLPDVHEKWAKIRGYLKKSNEMYKISELREKLRRNQATSADMKELTPKTTQNP